MTIKIKINQKFEGYVESIDTNRNEFSVHLYDITNPENPEMFCVLDNNILQKNLDTMQEGFIFKFSLGYEINQTNNTKQPYMNLEFIKETRTQEDFDNIEKEAELLALHLKSKFQ